MKHPARYTDAFLPVFAEWLDGRERVLDPFGGTGKLKEVCPRAICMDIEAEWAQMAGLRADATRLPFAKETFDAICTSPTYANRLADKTPGRLNYAARLGIRRTLAACSGARRIAICTSRRGASVCGY
jgi:hypothetical protein